jgi:hypothetical protein
VVKYPVYDGRTCGRRDSAAEIMTVSDDYDLAILRVRDGNFVEGDAEFYPEDKEMPYVGMPVLHVGCYHGRIAAASLSDGIIAYQGRINDGKVYDQVTVANFPGSSGGGVFDYEGKCIGILTRRADSVVGFIDPIREIRAWAKLADALWVVDNNVPVPPREKLIKQREEVGRKFILDRIKKVVIDAMNKEEGQ